jgi:aminopeptidase N
MVELTIEQKQTNGEPFVIKDGASTALFHLSAAVDVTYGDPSSPKKVTRVVELGAGARERVFISCEAKPLFVRFDSGNQIPKTLKFPRPKELLLYQLAHDEDSTGRIEALLELSREPAKFGTKDVLLAISKALMSDSFWGVQAEAASALASFRSDEAQNHLIAALSLKHPKARRAVVKALGKFKNERSADAIRKLAEKDESYFVEGEATSAWSQAKKLPGASEKLGAEMESFLLKQLERESYREQIRASALRALINVPGIQKGERPRALSALIATSGRTHSMDSRMAAIDAMGTLARYSVASVRKELFETLGVLSEEVNFRIRMALVHALESAESAEGIPLLARMRATDPDGRVKRAATNAIERIQVAGSAPESLFELKATVEKMEEEQRRLRSMIEELKDKA